MNPIDFLNGCRPSDFEKGSFCLLSYHVGFKPDTAESADPSESDRPFIAAEVQEEMDIECVRPPS